MPVCKPVKTAVIGCGAISDIYLTNMMRRFATTEVAACAASHRENAEKKAAQYGIRAASTDEIFADPEIEMIVVLTPAPSHYDLIQKALLAGKHVYTEKTMAVSLWQAREPESWPRWRRKRGCISVLRRTRSWAAHGRRRAWRWMRD